MLSIQSMRAGLGVGLLASLVAAAGASDPSARGGAGPMSLRDDQLYAELMIHEGTPYAPFFDGRLVRVILAIDDGELERVQAAISALGGTSQHVERDIGYLRAAIPFRTWPKARLLEGVTAANIDGPLAPLWRDGERTPLLAEDKGSGLQESEPVAAGHPVVTSQDIVAVGRTASQEALGLSRLWDAHPTFDGRGVGIAILEPLSGNTAFSHPALRSAWNADGQIVPKAADFVLPGSSPRRVTAEVEFSAKETFAWLPVGIARLPHPGTFRWGTSRLPSGPMPILWDTISGEVRIDTNRDLDYRDDEALRDARIDPDSSIAVPGVGRIRVTLSSDRREVRLHLGDRSHPTMTSSVAAGAERDGIAGTAPGARLIFVELGDTAPTSPYFGGSPGALIEGLLSAARHPDVDVISVSMVSLIEQPATAGDAVSVLARRIVDRYDKPIIKAANNGHGLATVDTLGDSSLVVGAFFPKSSAQRYLGASGTRDATSHFSSRGPRQDGAAAPDVVGPVGEPAANPCRPQSSIDRRPRFVKLPPCYGLSGGTSSASPAIAGLAASLLSGLKQQHRHVTADALYAALRAATRPLSEAVTAQGAGMPQADAAWSLLARDVAMVRVQSRAAVTHRLQSYLREEGQGPGLYEREGWRAGQSGRRTITFRRDTGPEMLQYELNVTGDMDTFSVPPRIALGKGIDVVVPVDIHVKHAGVHSARVTLRDLSGRTQTLDRQLTIVAADELPAAGNRASNRTYAGTLREFESRFVPVYVPAGVDTLRLVLDASEDVRVVVQDPMGRPVSRRSIEMPGSTNTARLSLIPQPMPGTWIVSPYRGGGEELAVSAGEREYKLDVATISHRLSPASPSASGSRALQIELPRTTEIDVISYHARTMSTTADAVVDVPVTLPFTVEDGATLAQWRVDVAGTGGVHVHLFDCSSGSCVRRESGGPAASAYTATVQRPAPGRWMLAVTSGPRSTTPQPFTVQFSVASAPAERMIPAASRPARQTFEVACNESLETRSLVPQLVPRASAQPPDIPPTSKERNVIVAALPAIQLMPCEAGAMPTMARGSRPRPAGSR